MFQASEAEGVELLGVTSGDFSDSHAIVLVSRHCGKGRWECRDLLYHACVLEGVIMLHKLSDLHTLIY